MESMTPVCTDVSEKSTIRNANTGSMAEKTTLLRQQLMAANTMRGHFNNSTYVTCRSPVTGPPACVDAISWSVLWGDDWGTADALSSDIRCYSSALSS